MKICFFNCAKVWGGGEKWHLDNANALAKKGHQIVVVSNIDSELLKRANNDNLRTKAFNISNLSFLSPFKRHGIYRFFEAEKFDVLVMNFSKDLKTAACAAKKAGIKRIIYRRGSDIPIKNSMLNRYLFGKCITDIIANSEATKRSILLNNNDLFPAEKIIVLYNGISFNGFENIKEEHNTPVIGTIGRLSYQKRHDLLVSIAKKLHDKNIDCHFIIGGDGELKNKIRKQIADNHLENYVEMSGFVNNPHEFLQQTDIFILTSEWEGFGYVLAEAMRARKPIVAFNTSSIPELIEDNKNGFLIPWNDTEAFADALIALLKDKKKREEMGDCGYNYALQKFDFEKNQEFLIDYFLKG
ncbi:MAG: glycosyltransferase [Candidatus Kapabacteria bacterium]|nr:glycosyltransferase [Candidatus Kapabacteria bacterium]